MKPGDTRLLHMALVTFLIDSLKLTLYRREVMLMHYVKARHKSDVPFNVHFEQIYVLILLHMGIELLASLQFWF